MATSTPHISPQPEEEIESKLKANPQYSHIKGIILKNGKEIKGQILHMSTYTVSFEKKFVGFSNKR